MTKDLSNYGCKKVDINESPLRHIMGDLVLDSNETNILKIHASLFGAFKPRLIQIFSIEEAWKEIPLVIEILEIKVLEMSQIICSETKKGLTKWFENPTPIDWWVFGSENQSLQIKLHNPTVNKAHVYVCIWGDPASLDMIGVW